MHEASRSPRTSAVVGLRTAPGAAGPPPRLPPPPNARRVKISGGERGGWSSARPRRGGAAAERPADVSVRGRVLSPSDTLRYSPGSLLVLVSPSAEERDKLLARVLETQSTV